LVDDNKKDNVSEDVKETKDNKKTTSVNVVIDRSPEMEELRNQLKKIEAEKERLAREAEEKLKKAQEEHLDRIRKMEEEKLAASREAERIKKEKEEFANKLQSISEQEFNKKREAILERAKTTFSGNEDKFNELKAKLEDPENGPENLKHIEYTLNIIDDALKVQREYQEKQEKEAEKENKSNMVRNGNLNIEGDTARLNNEQMGEKISSSTVEGELSWDSTEAMIKDLRAKASDYNPANASQRAEAESILKKMFQKWSKHAREQYTRGKPISKELIERHEHGEHYDEGYSPYERPEEIKSFKEMKRGGV
jgi:chromosome segregation ATPase